MNYYALVRKIEKYVVSRFSQFGPNKKQELIRLAYEILRQKKISLSALFDSEEKDFALLKERLLTLRYPQSYLEEGGFYLPKLELDPDNRVNIDKKLSFSLKNIFYERGLGQSAMFSRFRREFPLARTEEILSLKEYLRCKKFTLAEYNKRRENIFIVKERFDFFKPCPCTPGARGCGYYVLNLGFGCPFECVYCFLQGYQNFPGIIIPVNIEDFLKKITSPVRVGSGEFTDSLVFDRFSEFSLTIADYLRKHPKVVFEFKTKSVEINNLLKTKPQNNLVVSWSLNPKKIIQSSEFYTASLSGRLSAAAKLVSAGFRVGFHFDPIIYYKGWEVDYEDLVDNLFTRIPASSIAWISLGTLRLEPPTKKVIENRFPDNGILDEELVLGFDGKLRYYQALRLSIYKKMSDWIKKRAPKVWLYLCMEK